MSSLKVVRISQLTSHHMRLRHGMKFDACGKRATWKVIKFGNFTNVVYYLGQKFDVSSFEKSRHHLLFGTWWSGRRKSPFWTHTFWSVNFEFYGNVAAPVFHHKNSNKILQLLWSQKMGQELERLCKWLTLNVSFE